ncbi:hypothetical protein G7K_1494-t1 [Saitoella complicata NRRL Y-17804]|uniref:Uncharacterized protein n=1 Tax=Saitoella complicata (strain BCRC 22490 / CBS 7301 / JCM 7358 / NBRC 10748 / NRRL Y-17804) TaxID=698492 RepID=A0A0E9NBR9_SAICN|nr:hypothetical protein G7K_1494-t1 [Saitoella complicata NRRL Y-17804]
MPSNDPAPTKCLTSDSIAKLNDICLPLTPYRMIPIHQLLLPTLHIPRSVESGPKERVTAKPLSLHTIIKVSPREHILLQMIREPRRLSLVETKLTAESLIRHSTILELRQNQLAVRDEEGAGGVSVVGCVRGLSVRDAVEVVCKDGGLREDCRGGFGGGKGGGVTQRPHIIELLALEGSGVNVDETRCVSQGRFSNESVGTHLGDDVEEVEGFVDGGAVGLLEGCDMGLTIDCDEVRGECTLYATVDTELLECLGVLRHGKHCAHARVELQVNLITNTCIPPCILRHPHHLLGRTGTLDDTSGLGEDRLSALEGLDVVLGDVTGVVAVNGGDTILAQGLGESSNGAPLDVQTGGDDEVVVGNRVTRPSSNLVRRGIDLGDISVVELDICGDEGSQGTVQVSLVGETGTDQSPSGLVVVNGGTVDNRDIILLQRQGTGRLGFTSVGIEKLVCDVDTTRTATDDDNLVVGRGMANGRCNGCASGGTEGGCGEGHCREWREG